MSQCIRALHDFGTCSFDCISSSQSRLVLLGAFGNLAGKIDNLARQPRYCIERSARPTANSSSPRHSPHDYASTMSSTAKRPSRNSNSETLPHTPNWRIQTARRTRIEYVLLHIAARTTVHRCPGTSRGVSATAHRCWQTTQMQGSQGEGQCLRRWR